MKNQSNTSVQFKKSTTESYWVPQTPTLPVTVMLPVENILRQAFGDFNRYVTPGCNSGS